MSSCRFPILAVLAMSLPISVARAVEPGQSPQQLIKDVVFNELRDHRQHGFFSYMDSKHSGRQTVVKAEIETRNGRVSRILTADGEPLTPQLRGEESRRLELLLHDSGQQQKLLRDYEGDEDRIARIVGLLPEGFLYEYDGIDGEEVRLRYRPNPAFRPPTYEARVFHAMAGTVWINLREKRLTRLQGQLVANVDFGYGLLGRLDRGGTFNMERVEVTAGNWKTRVLNVHIAGHVILLKSIGKDQDEVRSEFREVPGDLSLEQAEAMLKAAISPADARDAQSEPGLSPTEKNGSRKVAAALALK